MFVFLQIGYLKLLFSVIFVTDLYHHYQTVILQAFINTSHCSPDITNLQDISKVINKTNIQPKTNPLKTLFVR